MSAKTAIKTAKRAAPSPRNGVQLPVGAHPGNTGGKKGRSGRRPDAFREELAAIRDHQGLPLVQKLLAGEVAYTFRGKCSHCGKQSKGPSPSAVVRLAPSADTQIRVVEMLCKHTLPAEKVIRIDGYKNARLVFDTIKERIEARLGEEQARELIADITTTLEKARGNSND